MSALGVQQPAGAFLYVSVSPASVGGSEFLCVCRSVCISGSPPAVCLASLGGEGLVTHDSS